MRDHSDYRLADFKFLSLGLAVEIVNGTKGEDKQKFTERQLIDSNKQFRTRGKNR
ncbi:MAG: hypothetical protein PUP91_35040 [Rhizonema sp. PD37]|nr:hypothetical protein [Rhizonema sp. PD37]